MSLDNVIAVAAAAGGSVMLLILGLAISIPLVIFGATLLLKLMERLPIIITIGAGLDRLRGRRDAGDDSAHRLAGSPAWACQCRGRASRTSAAGNLEYLCGRDRRGVRGRCWAVAREAQEQRQRRVRRGGELLIGVKVSVPRVNGNRQQGLIERHSTERRNL